MVAIAGGKEIPDDEEIEMFVERQLELVKLECAAEEQVR